MSIPLRWISIFVVFLAGLLSQAGPTSAADAPVPLLTKGQPVDWWFVFKFNSGSFKGCGGDDTQSCPFGGKVRKKQFSQQFVYSSIDSPTLKKGSGCLGDTETDPVGATFGEVYEGGYSYVVWNDQFYQHPKIAGCSDSCGKPWGHSKGMVAWNKDGEGVVMQVTTPSWPGAGSQDHKRSIDGNTLGCVTDNNVMVSQHFFALRLTKEDLVKVLKALRNANVVTKQHDATVVNPINGPIDVLALATQLGVKVERTEATKELLSTGAVLISKPSGLHAPPWQLVSAMLDGVALRTATWWNANKIYTTTASSKIGCWDESLGAPGPIEIAMTGKWGDTEIGLKGGGNAKGNHAKIGVSTDGEHHYAIFGDMNQEGSIKGKITGKSCNVAQNPRGGLFFVLDNKELAASISDLIDGETAPTKAPSR